MNSLVIQPKQIYKKQSILHPSIQPKLEIGKPNDKYEKQADAVANRVVAMPNTAVAVQMKSHLSSPDISMMCAECDNEKGIQMQPNDEEEVRMKPEEEEDKIQMKPSIQRSAIGVMHVSTEFANKLESQNGQGHPLPSSVNNEMGNKIGSDFSNVEIHTDNQAVQMSQEIGAQAFTHGNHVYFNNGKYDPGSSGGKHLLAHELTHVVQQNGVRKKSIQRITCSSTTTTPPARATTGQSNRLDQRARNIISIATNTQYTNVQKASRLITAIICHYYPQHAGLVRNISYVANTAGLATTSVGRGNSARGDIEVGDYFIQHTTSRGISRRILQVGHELRHILQYRQGLTGRSNKNEREFLAFHENALADEFVGTGRMSRATRRNLIDAALGYYYCLSQQKQTRYATEKQALLTKRQQINQSAGSGSTNAPTTCAHP